MAIRTVGPTSTFPTIAAAMAASVDADTIQLEAGYKNETATVTHNGMTVTGGATSTGIVLHLATGVALATFTLAGAAPINVFDNEGGNGIVGNDGNNVITVTNGADAVSGGLGTDRLVVDYHLGTTAVTGDSTSNFADASGRLVTINGGFENITVLTGSGADTITTGTGDDIINTGNGVSTVVAGEGANSITGGVNADTVTAGNGGNFIDGGDGTNTLTSGTGADTIIGGLGADTVVAGGGADLITMSGGADTVHGDAGTDRLVVNYAASTTVVTMAAPTGSLAAGYTGSVADTSGNAVGFDGVENFTVTGGTANDLITTGDGSDIIQGGAGGDTINAGLGTDTLTGGVGKDILTGGGDHDVFDFNTVKESAKGLTTRDVITDFTHGIDDIDLSTIDANFRLQGNQHFSFIGVSQFGHEAGQLRIITHNVAGTVNDKTYVAGDVNGDGRPDFMIELNGNVHLTQGDFVL
jgi:Ca2+-binding RTX toxin-like protein